MTFDDQWVDEVKRGFKACAVFCWFPIYCACVSLLSIKQTEFTSCVCGWHLGLTYGQMNNNLTSQAATMETHGLPNDVLSNLNPFALIIFIPVFDIFVRDWHSMWDWTGFVISLSLPVQVYPALRRAGINFSPLKKITAGFFTGAAAMTWAAVVQHYVYKVRSKSHRFVPELGSSAVYFRSRRRTLVDASPQTASMPLGSPLRPLSMFGSKAARESRPRLPFSSSQILFLIRAAGIY